MIRDAGDLECGDPILCNVATLIVGVRCMCGALLPYKDSFQSKPCGPPQTAGLISAEFSPIFYLLLNIYSRLNPVSLSVSHNGAAAAGRKLHIYEMPEVCLLTGTLMSWA